MININYFDISTTAKNYLLGNLPKNCIWTDCSLWADRGTLNYRLIERYINSKNTVILIDLSEPYSPIEFAKSIKDLGVNNALILHTDWNVNQSDCLFFPTDFILRSLSWTPNVQTQRTFLLSCLNRRLTTARVYNFLELHKRPYFSQSIVTMSLHGITQEKLVDLTNKEFADLPIESRYIFLSTNQ